MTSLSFWTNGESFTRMARDFWIEGSVKIAFEVLGGNDLPVEVQTDILTGKRRFEGDTRVGDGTLMIVEDNISVDPSIEDQVNRLERWFIDKSSEVASIKRKLSFSPTPNGKWAMYRSSRSDSGVTAKQLDEERIRNLEKDIKGFLESLTLLYPLVNKTMADLPTLEIGTTLSSIEVQEMGYIWREFEERKQLNQSFSLSSHQKEYVPPKPQTDNIEKHGNGWLSPDGKFYPCAYMGHRDLAYDMDYHKLIPETDNAHDYLEECGWVKLSGYSFHFFSRSEKRHLTKKQKDSIITAWMEEGVRKEFNGTIFKSFDEFYSFIDKYGY